MEDYIKIYNQTTEGLGKFAAGADEYKIEKDLLNKAGLKPGCSVLDYGCGWGSLLEVIDVPTDYLGLDISPLMIELAKSYFPDEQFSLCNPGSVDEGEFDVVLAHSVFTHIPKQYARDCLQDIRRSLKKKALIDIFYHTYESPIWEAYSHKQWLKLLTANGLKGQFIKSRSRTAGITHHYYLIEKVA